MNHLAKIEAAAPEMSLAPDYEPGKLWELQVTAGALEKAAIRLRATPNYPDCQSRRASYRSIVQECIEDMRKVLNDA